MSRHITLRNRIRRLEARRKFRRSRLPILYVVAGANDAAIVGIQSVLGAITKRGHGEALETLASRAAGAAGSARIGFARYGAGTLDFIA